MADSATCPWYLELLIGLRGAVTCALWWRPRLAAMVILLITVPLLITAAALEPDAAGTGTHTQLGLPPCGFYTVTRIPCATCGYTTAFSHAARGQLLTAFYIQPAGAAAGVLVAAMAIVGGYALITAVPLGPLGRWLCRLQVMLVGGGLVIGAWIYKILLVQGVL